MTRVYQHLSSVGVLGAFMFLFAMLASTSTPAMAQQQQQTNTTSPEAAVEEEADTTTAGDHGHEQSLNETTTRTTEAEQDTFTVRDSVFAVLADQTIPTNGYLHLYDTTPYIIANGHVAAKIPCDEESNPALNILVGQAPNLMPAPTELIANLSSPGELCLYHADLPATSESAQGNTTELASTNSTTTSLIPTTQTPTTDVAISNLSDEDVTLPPTNTVVIGINQIAQGPHGHEEEPQGDVP